ncbi:MAG: Decaprenyl-monophosphoryl-beta-D-arabinose (DPA) translocase to periplasm, partial [uncultured Blastococcus sp.]
GRVRRPGRGPRRARSAGRQVRDGRRPGSGGRPQHLPPGAPLRGVGAGCSHAQLHLRDDDGVRAQPPLDVRRGGGCSPGHGVRAALRHHVLRDHRGERPGAGGAPGAFVDGDPGLGAVAGVRHGVQLRDAAAGGLPHL